MPIINDNLDKIFGQTDSFFINTTPRKFLFEGVEFCKSPVDLPKVSHLITEASQFLIQFLFIPLKVICNLVEDRQSPSITRSKDGTALVFSMFAHVTFAVIFNEEIFSFAIT